MKPTPQASTSDERECRPNGGQEAHLDNGSASQSQSYLQAVVKGADPKDVEIRNSPEFLRPEGDMLMVACFAEGTLAEDGDELSLALATVCEQRKLKVKQQLRDKDQ
jgi:hypothetical protein